MFADKFFLFFQRKGLPARALRNPAQPIERACLPARKPAEAFRNPAQSSRSPGSRSAGLPALLPSLPTRRAALRQKHASPENAPKALRTVCAARATACAKLRKLRGLKNTKAIAVLDIQLLIAYKHNKQRFFQFTYLYNY